jgi:hypothetical protein
VTNHRLPGIYTRAAADVAEMTRAELRDDGVRVTQGVYLSRALPPTAANIVRAAREALPPDALASHRTAAGLLHAPVAFRGPLDFTVRPGMYRPRRRGIRTHVRDLTDADRIELYGIPMTSGAQTWLDLAAELPDDELVAVGDALCRAAHLDGVRTADRLRRADGVRGVVRARRCAPLLTPLAASRPESLIRFWLIDAGLPAPEPQLAVVDPSGREVAHADLGYPEWKVLVEYEGRQHADRGQFGRDVNRYSLMAAGGWLVVRLGSPQLRPEVVVDRVGRALRSRGARW